MCGGGGRTLQSILSPMLLKQGGNTCGCGMRVWACSGAMRRSMSVLRSLDTSSHSSYLDAKPL